MTRPKDPDHLLDTVAKAILATRAPGLGKRQWARRAAAAVLDILSPSDSVGAPEPALVPSPVAANPSPGKPVIRIIHRQCGGWLGTYRDGSLNVGVTEDTEDATRDALTACVKRWKTLVSDLPAPMRDENRDLNEPLGLS